VPPPPPPLQPKKSAAPVSIVASPTQARRLRDRWRSAQIKITSPSNRRSHANTTRQPGEKIGGRKGTGGADWAVVVAVTVAFWMVVPFTISGLGETLQVE
jgi:hypothetical protein